MHKNIRRCGLLLSVYSGYRKAAAQASLEGFPLVAGMYRRSALRTASEIRSLAIYGFSPQRLSADRLSSSQIMVNTVME